MFSKMFSKKFSLWCAPYQMRGFDGRVKLAVLLLFLVAQLVLVAGTIVIKESNVPLERLLALYREEVLKREKVTKFVFEVPHLNFYLISNYFAQNVWKDGDIKVELGGYSMNGTVDNRNRCSELTIKSEFTETDEEYEHVKKFIAQRLPEILAGATSDIEKVWAINEWMKSWIEYDWSYKRTTSYQAIVEKTVVCNGYAMLFYRIAKAAGLEVKFITGTVRGTRVAGRHAWNAVKIGGLWYFVDVTWNDVEHSGNLYLLASMKDMSVSHRVEHEVLSPLAQEHYFDTLYKRIVNERDRNAFSTLEKLYGHKLGFNRNVLYNAVIEAVQKGKSTLFYDSKTFKDDLESVLKELFDGYSWSVTYLDFKKTFDKNLRIYTITVNGNLKVRELRPRDIFGG